MNPVAHLAFGEDWIDPVVFTLPRGAGKAGPTMAGPMAPGSALRRSLSAVTGVRRRHVQTRDVRLHLTLFGEDCPTEEIKRLRDGVIMTVAGYDKDPREIYEIPEIRRYWTEVQQQCPTILFFAASEYPPALQAIFACMASRLEITRQKGSELIRVCIEGQSIKPMLAIEMSNHVTLDRDLGLQQHDAMTEVANSLAALVGKDKLGME
jgi:hypothetical protein